jgi:hypothetical protein
MDVGKVPDTKGWPPQLYVRAARRLIGQYVLTQNDIQLQTEIPDSIGLGFYAIDLHLARMLVLEDGSLGTEGAMTMLVSPGPWGLPYRFITPKRKECTNLLVPVCFSASHLAHGATRLEAQYMIIGESSGIAAAQAIDEGKAVQEIDVKRLQKRLLEHGQRLEWDGKGYGWYRTCMVQKLSNVGHVIYRWQNHPEEYPKSMPKPRPDIPILVDDTHAERVGEWEELSKHQFFVYQGYLQDNGTGKGKKSVIFKPIIRRSGDYEVMIAYPQHSENSKRVPVHIRHADGEDTVLVDQTRRKRNGTFDPVGTFRFKADGQSAVTVQTQGTEDGLVLVDAIRFLPAWQQTDIEIGVGGKSRRASDDDKKYDILEISDELKGLSTATIPRGGGNQPAPGFAFTIDKDSEVYIAVHDRGGYKPPEGWMKTDMILKWRPEFDETDTVYTKSFSKGVVEVPGHSGKTGSIFGVPNMAFIKSGKVEKCD